MSPLLKDQGLYEVRREHDACGIGAVVHISGKKDHSIVEYSKQILLNLHHRGAASADDVTGDGAGILTQIPDAFFRMETQRLGICLPEAGRYGIGMVFSPKDTGLRSCCYGLLEQAAAHYGLRVLGWRCVPA
ncbi:MAG TPA: hypothetical protein PLE88_08705, partial [Anaerohalosphaeraceae bacterium]|nr:hypothetical protein [Anaerohalosphaeraceae bacterium]